MTLSKRIKVIKENFNFSKSYSIDEAITIMKENSKVKFDETLEISVKLGIDPKQSDQMVRGVVSLPYGTGKKVRVAVFAKDAKAEEAKLAGAEIVGAEDLLEKINEGQIDFDRCIATPDMMLLVGRVAKILGPKGLMPNPKTGSVTLNIKEAVSVIKAGQVEFRTEKAGIIHAGLGKLSFSKEKLVENVRVFLNTLNKLKPVTSKGIFIIKVNLSTTMGIGLKVNLSGII